MHRLDVKSGLASYLALFSSLGTLVCCAIPAILVSLGMGASLAGLLSAAPQLVWLSDNKILIFTISAAMIAISGIATYRAKDLPCPIDPKLRAACIRGRKFSALAFWISAACFTVGAFFAFVAPKLLN